MRGEREGDLFTLSLFYSVLTQYKFVDQISAVLQYLYIVSVCAAIKHSYCNLKSFSEDLTLRKRYSQIHLKALASFGSYSSNMY